MVRILIFSSREKIMVSSFQNKTKKKKELYKNLQKFKQTKNKVEHIKQIIKLSHISSKPKKHRTYKFFSQFRYRKTKIKKTKI